MEETVYQFREETLLSCLSGIEATLVTEVTRKMGENARPIVGAALLFREFDNATTIMQSQLDRDVVIDYIADELLQYEVAAKLRRCDVPFESDLKKYYFFLETDNALFERRRVVLETENNFRHRDQLDRPRPRLIEFYDRTIDQYDRMEVALRKSLGRELDLHPNPYRTRGVPPNTRLVWDHVCTFPNFPRS